MRAWLGAGGQIRGNPFTPCGNRFSCPQLLLNFLFISLVPIIGIFGGAVVPLYKGMMSQTVDPDERGQFLVCLPADRCPVLSMKCAHRESKRWRETGVFLTLTNDASLFFPRYYCNRYFSCSVGAMFSSVTTVDTFCNFLGAFIFNPMYIRSSNFGFPGLPFLVSAVLIIIPLIMTK